MESILLNVGYAMESRQRASEMMKTKKQLASVTLPRAVKRKIHLAVFSRGLMPSHYLTSPRHRIPSASNERRRRPKTSLAVLWPAFQEHQAVA